MRRNAWRHGCWLALLVGCGARSSLFSADSGAAAGGSVVDLGGATSGAGVLAAGGAGAAGTMSSEQAGSSDRAGASFGGASAGASSGGASAGASNSVCENPSLLSVTPANARSSVGQFEPIAATFSCAPDPKLVNEGTLRAAGAFQAGLPAKYLFPPASARATLEPMTNGVRGPYFPGELVTGWVGARLGGPFQWQYRAAVRAGSSAQFTDTGQALSPAMDARLADLDHDGDLDLVTGNAQDHTGRVYLNDGTGNFSLKALLPPIGLPLLGDVDHDGDVDLVSDHVYLNDGSASFSESDALGEVHALFDADGDGDLDVFAVQSTDQWSLFQNDGAGHFTPSHLGEGAVFDAQTGDLDNDGDIDLVLTIYSNAAASFRGVVLLNDGTGAFSEVASGITVDATRAVSLGDLDGDGDLDVVTANWGAAGARNPLDQIWLNDGTAHFHEGDAPLSGSIEFSLADLDGDGDLDAIAGQHSPYSSNPGDPSRVLFNDGAGHFTLGGSVGGSNFQHLAVGDLDGDGDLDAVVAEWDWTARPALQVWLQGG